MCIRDRDDLLNVDCMEIIKEQEEKCSYLEGSYEALQRLSTLKNPKHILTNGDPRVQEYKAETQNFLEFFDSIFYSMHAGYPKEQKELLLNLIKQPYPQPQKYSGVQGLFPKMEYEINTRNRHFTIGKCKQTINCFIWRNTCWKMNQYLNIICCIIFNFFYFNITFWIFTKIKLLTILIFWGWRNKL